VTRDDLPLTPTLSPNGERERSEPSPGCGRGQGEGCLFQPVHRPLPHPLPRREREPNASFSLSVREREPIPVFWFTRKISRAERDSLYSSLRVTVLDCRCSYAATIPYIHVCHA